MAAVWLLTPSPKRALRQAWLRLLMACSLSLLFHLALLWGIAVNPTRGAANVIATLHARLEPVAESVQQARETALAPTEKAGAAAGVDRTPQRAEFKTEPALAPIGSLEAPGSRDTNYYPAQQLDVYPRPLTPIKLDHPELATQRIDARLLLLLLIDESGIVNEASVVEAQPEGYSDTAALSVLRATRFAPAQKQGRPVKCQVLLQVSYTDGDREPLR